MSAAELRALGWDGLDVLLVNGDAYVDHPSVGVALLARWLIRHGFRTGIVAQPRWEQPDDLLVMGRPRLFAGVSAGALDSLLAHYTAFRKKRRDDADTPGGRAGARPNRACLVYANLVRRAFPGLPIVLGGIEASLRRVTHYDFWTDALRRPILLDAKADLLIWGMGELAIVEVARRLDVARGDADAPPPGGRVSCLLGIPGTAWVDRLDSAGRPLHLPGIDAPCVELPAHEAVQADAFNLMRLTLSLEQQVHSRRFWAFQPVGGRAVVLAPPAPCLSTAQMDELYGLPFARRAHPAYHEPVPAAEMLATSVTSHRGCGGGCSFCSLALHQGRRISSRSEASILAEARRLGQERLRRGKGPVAISDVGGPTANMWGGRCALDARSTPGSADAGATAACRRSSCCHPTVCRHFITPQDAHVALLRRVAALPEVRQVRVASGVRADLALRAPDALAAYAGEFTGGQLKLAPEHCSPAVLALMRKPPLEVFERFLDAFTRQRRRDGHERYVVPYLMSAFPGCTDEDMRALARWLAARHWNPRQTQCFIPTPGTVATAMFYCGRDEAGAPLYVARSDAARLRQHRILMPLSATPPGCGHGQAHGKPAAGHQDDAGPAGCGKPFLRRKGKPRHR